MNYKVLQDSDGNTSSKSVFGAIVLIVGLIGHLFLGIFSIFSIAADPATAVASFNTMMFVGGGLLGVSVLEFLKGR